MNRDGVLDLCTALRGAVEDYPFGDDVAVFTVGGRMFALITLNDTPGRINLKCEPGRAQDLRARHPSVLPGYHANKRHWNTVVIDGSVPDDELREMIEHSYELVVIRLPHAQRARLA